MSGRSGYLVPADLLIVQPGLAGLLVAFTSDAPAQFRARGLPVPREWTDWSLDLRDYADRVRPLPEVDLREPAVWLDVATVVEAFAAAGVPVSSRTVTTWARTGKIRAKKPGRRAWLVDADAVDAAIAERQREQVPLPTERNDSGSRYEPVPAPLAS